MQRIKLVFSALVLSSFLFSTCYADSSNCKSSSQQMELEKFNRDPHVGLSFMYDGFTKHFFPEVTFLWDWFEAGVGANYEHVKHKNKHKYDQTNLAFHAGFRMDLVEKLSGSVGYIAVVGFLSGDYEKAGIDKTPYVMGPYLGLNYAITNNLEAYARIEPYSYEKRPNHSKVSSVFTNGQIGLNWYFF